MTYPEWKAIYIDKSRTLRNWEIIQAIKAGGTVNVGIKGLGEGHIPTAKLTQYALNPVKSPDKAMAFKKALGYELSNAEKLVGNIERNINKFSIEEKSNAGYGKRFQIVLELVGENGKTAKMLTAWIIDKDTGEIRLTTLYVDKKIRDGD